MVRTVRTGWTDGRTLPLRDDDAPRSSAPSALRLASAVSMNVSPDSTAASKAARFVVLSFSPVSP